MAGIPTYYDGKELAERFGTTVEWIRQEIAKAGGTWTRGPRGQLKLDQDELDFFLASRKQRGDDSDVVTVAYPVAREPQLRRDGSRPRIPPSRRRTA